MDSRAYEQETLRRLPLAEAALVVLDQALPAQAPCQLFDRLRGDCYHRRLGFDTFVALIRDALLHHRGSGRKAFAAARDRGQLDVSNDSCYGKLARVPVALSEALLAESSDRLAALLPDGLPSPLPACLRRLNVQILDGKVTKRVAKRLRLLRGLAGGAIGGKGLVSLHYNSGLVGNLAGCPDGDANDASLVESLVKQVHARLGEQEVILWVGDAQFADLTQTYRFKGPGGKHHFLLRYHSSTKFCPGEGAPEAVAHPGLLAGTDGRGRAFRQEFGWLGAASNKKRMWVRRITLERPGEAPVVIVTSLLDAVAYPAEDLLEAYLGRGSIEGVFQKITEVFSLSRLISSRPKGTVFQLAFCLVLFNAVAVVCAHLAAGQGLAPAEVSAEMVFEDVREELTALARVLSSPVGRGAAGGQGSPGGQQVPGRPGSPAGEGAAAAGQEGGARPGGQSGKAQAGPSEPGWEGWSVRLAGLIPARSPQQARRRLAELLGGLWRPIWRKAANKKRRPHPDKPRDRVHCCVHRILQADQARPRQPP